jgi:hypothetical protein
MADAKLDFLSTKFSANDLRALAEASDSIRGEDACIVANPAAGGPPFVVMTKAAAAQAKLPPIIDLRTEDNPTLSAPRKQLKLTSDRKLRFVKGLARDINDCDAIFTSLAAVEKFVVPYYARMCGLEACEEMRAGFAANADAVAVLHLPGSVEDEALADGATNVYLAMEATPSSLQLLSVSQFLALQ